MKAKAIISYRCDYCNKFYQSKYHCTKHEKLCWHNPANKRPCLTCEYLGKKHAKVMVDSSEYGEIKTTLSVFCCTKRDIYLHLPQSDIKGNIIDLVDDINYRMPKKCTKFKLNTNPL